MPVLCATLNPSDSRTGFCLPLFKHYTGANYLLTQRIELSGNVVGFDGYLLSDADQLDQDREYQVDEGEPALWCFKLPDGQMMIGTAEQIRTSAVPILGTGTLVEYPMAAADLAAFCEAEAAFPDVMLAAYRAAEGVSKQTAEVWRDAVVLLPLVQQDLREQVGGRQDIEDSLRSIICLSRSGITHIFAPADVLQRKIANLARWRGVAKIFGIQHYEFHSVETFDKRTEAVPFSWRLIGTGGVGRWAVRNTPFKGVLRSSHISNEKYAIAEAPILPGQACERSLIMAVVGAQYENIRTAERAAVIKGSWPITKHVMMVRPLGFGTPRPSKLPIERLPQAMPTSDFVWIVANHRRRRPFNTSPNLAASRVAARFVRSCARALIDLHSSKRGTRILDETIDSHKFGLVGATKHSRSYSYTDYGRDNMVRRALASAITEDAYLQTARRIIALWPEDDFHLPSTLSVRLGRHKYDVEVLPVSVRRNQSEVVVLALDVALSKRTPMDFEDFCVSLISEFFWVERDRMSESILFEDEGEGFRLWPVSTASDLRRLVRRRAELASPYDLIITNQTVPSAVAQTARENGWELIHYSDLFRWMSQHFPENAASADENNRPDRSGN